MKKRELGLLVVGLFMAVVFSCAGAGASLQELIDNSSDAIIEVPAGTYQGPIVLNDDQFLVGAGADSTILEIPEGAVGVRGGHRSALMGFTVKGGNVGAQGQGQFLGVFECRFVGQRGVSVLFDNGCGVIANSVLQGQTPGATGVSLHRANPFLCNNVFASLEVGVRVSDTLVPVLQDNLFVDNKIAVLLEKDAHVRLVGNRYSGCAQTVQGGTPGESDRMETVAWDGSMPVVDATIEQYQTLMKTVYSSALLAHPCVIYGLGSELGAFDVVILWHRATFSIGASTPDTVIRAHTAYDMVTQNDLNSQYRYEGRAFVDVINPLVMDAATERYVLENRYEHAPSLFINEQGQRVFRRETNLTRVEVFCPPGWVPVAVNMEAAFDKVNGQIVVKVTRPGNKTVEVVMEPTGTAAVLPGVPAL